MFKIARWMIVCILPLVLWALPASWIPINNLSVVQHRVLVIFVAAALLWILEPIPIYATSIVVITLQLLLVSNKGLIWFCRGSGDNFGQLLNYKNIFQCFGSPIILLFVGGFFLAHAATKYRLDLNLARIFILPFGKRPQFVILGIMLVTAFFSCFMSNTATTAMMLAIITPVLSLFPEEDPGRIALCLAIPFAANIGGLGTPIGTPPNAIALKYLPCIQFGTWMLFAIPYILVGIVLCWLIIIKLYSPKVAEIELNIRSEFAKDWRAILFYITFPATVLLWLTGFLHGINSYTVAMIPVAIFSATKIITAQELKGMSWDVLWLLTGGIALGQSLEQSGLAKSIITSIPFAQMSPYWIILIATAITFLLANFMSHTAAANLLLPIIAILGTTPSLVDFGGKTMLILSVTFLCSLSMILPISTPPNALAHATGNIKTKDMFRAGIMVGILGAILWYFYAYCLVYINFFMSK